jgi:phage shock protein PspC (stress-responsive transcriptional regulator)
VCAAIGRATNTDPILWRVLLAVLGFFGGIGIVIYLAAWLIIPAEGDSASPVESMLGRGRSSMSPVTVIVLGILAVVIFGMIVTDRFLAVVLGAAVLVGGALLLNRNTRPVAGGTPAANGPTSGGSPGPGFTPGPEHSPPAGPFAAEPGQMPEQRPAAPSADPPGPVPPAGTPPPGPGLGAWSYASPGGPSAGRGAEPPSSGAAAPQSAWPPPAEPPALGQPVPSYTAPATAGGYRPPFAPHGPYGGPGSYPPPSRHAKPPKPPKERSPLGAATFSMIFVAIGMVAILDLANVIRVAPSTYFFAALVTIALGLLVGAWLGRARWLIALGVVAAVALGISTVAESAGPERYRAGSVLWQPASYDAMAERYENAFGDAELDLSRVDFTNRNARVVVQANFGSLSVILPPNVDVAARVDVNAGDAQVLGRQWSGFEQSPREVTDYGDDGRGGGDLNLEVHVNAGSVEVHR